MPQTLDIEIKTLTPLWTGGIDGSCDQLHISGLMGSLRYWYEAIVRGVGGYACDPSNGGGCIYTHPDKEHPETTGIQNICAACYLFGTTGWARLFRLSLVGEPPKTDKTHGVLPNQKFRLRFLFRPAKEMHKSIDYPKEQLIALLGFIQQYGGLGARLQKRFGLVEIRLIEAQPFSFKQALEDVRDYQGAAGINQPQWPDLRQFFSYVYSSSDKPSLVSAPSFRQKRGRAMESPLKNSAIRTWLEQELIGTARRQLTLEEVTTLDIVFGCKSTDEDKKRSSRICIVPPSAKPPAQQILHLYGFGIAGLTLASHHLNGSGLQLLIEKYIAERWQGAQHIQKWKDSKEEA